MRDIIDRFCGCFPSISFDVTEEKVKIQLSVESVSTGEREIQRMLNSAVKQLSKFKKLHRLGKVSTEDVFDCEWRVSELEEELKRFKSDLNPDELEDLL